MLLNYYQYLAHSPINVSSFKEYLFYFQFFIPLFEV